MWRTCDLFRRGGGNRRWRYNEGWGSGFEILGFWSFGVRIRVRVRVRVRVRIRVRIRIRVRVRGGD